MTTHFTTAVAGTLTTRQRDLMLLLLQSPAPLRTKDVADRMGVSVRQINYDLKLIGQSTPLQVRPVAGAGLSYAPEQRSLATAVLQSGNQFQLVLSGRQRQLLLAILLLSKSQALTLGQLQDKLQVSRTTIIKDLRTLRAGFAHHRLKLESRPHVGNRVLGPENGIRQALAAFVWAASHDPHPLLRVDPDGAVHMCVSSDRRLLAATEELHTLLMAWNTRTAFQLVADAVAPLGAQFSDDALFQVALLAGIQAWRKRHGYVAASVPDAPDGRNALGLACHGLTRALAAANDGLPNAEVAWLQTQFLAAPRATRLADDMAHAASHEAVLDRMIDLIAREFALRNVSSQSDFRECLFALLAQIQARQQHDIAAPMSALEAGVELEHVAELACTQRLAEMTRTQLGLVLEAEDRATLAMLIRSVRLADGRGTARHALVVCPSGMATSQLLLARVRNQFPQFASVRVLSLRELSREALTPAHVIITTAALSPEASRPATVIHVHPLLSRQDFEHIEAALNSERSIPSAAK